MRNSTTSTTGTDRDPFTLLPFEDASSQDGLMEAQTSLKEQLLSFFNGLGADVIHDNLYRGMRDVPVAPVMSAAPAWQKARLEPFFYGLVHDLITENTYRL